MKKLLTTLIILVFAVTMTLFTWGCNEKESLPAEAAPDNVNPLNINIGSLKGPTSIGMIKLHYEKPSLGEMVNTSYEIVQSPDIMTSELLAGDMDIATLPTNVAVKLYNKGLDYKLGAIVGYGVLYILSQNIEIDSWEDLKGEKINITSKGSTPDVILRYLLKENSIEPDKDVELNYSIEQVELSQLLISGKAELAILPEPFVTMVLNKNNNVKVVFDVEAEWEKIQNESPLPMSCVVISPELIDNHTDIIDTFLEKYRESIQWVNENPEEASAIVEKYGIGMDQETAMEAIPRCHIDFTGPAQAKDSVNNYIQVILNFFPEDVGGRMPDENFYYKD